MVTDPREKKKKRQAETILKVGWFQCNLMHDCSWRKIFTNVFIFQAYVTSLSEALNK